MRCDVSSEESVKDTLEEVRLCTWPVEGEAFEELCPIEGVIHSAGVLSDGLLSTGAAVAGCDAVWAAKVTGALNMANLTAQASDPLKLFVCYSSITSCTGNIGQTAYSAANSCLDTMMQRQRACHKPGLSVQWPAIEGVGMAARGGATAHRGVLSCTLTEHEVKANLFTLITREWGRSEVTLTSPACGDSCFYDTSAAEDSAVVLVLPRNAHQVGDMMRALALCKTGVSNTFSEVKTEIRSESPLVTPKITINSMSELSMPSHKPTSASSPTRQTMSEEAILDAVTAIAKSFISDQQVLRLDAPLMQQGVDSLGATELSAKLESKFGLHISPVFLFSHPTVTDIVQFFAAELSPSQHLPGPETSVQSGAGAVPRKSTSHHGSSISSQSDDHRAGAVVEDVAIVGLACHLPGDINSLADLWTASVTKRDTCSSISASRWDADSLLMQHGEYSRDTLGAVNFGSFLSEDFRKTYFSGKDFGISELESASMSLSQKLLLVTSAEALGDGGYDITQLKDQLGGVFVAASGFLSQDSTSGAEAASQSRRPSVYDVTGNTLSVAAGRISFALGLRGPCSTVDTACSSSLVAMHAARRSLQHGECDFAVVSSVNIIDQNMSISCAAAGMLSPDGKCHTFDAAANGYCRGEGCGAVVLKRLSDAERDGDRVYAVVRGSAVMQDGRSASLTAPNGLAQEQLLRAALSDAGVSACDVRFVEAHGTGTMLGDPIETEALAAVYGSSSGRSVDRPLLVGSVKANVGHLEAAAGLAGVFAVVAGLQRGQCGPNGQLRELNAKVSATVHGHPIVFPTESVQLFDETIDGANVGSDGGDSDMRVLAGVSSFGYSGTIAHLVLESAPVCNISTSHLDDITIIGHSEGASATGLETLTDAILWRGYDWFTTEPVFSSAILECDAVVRQHTSGGVSVSELLYPVSGGRFSEAEAEAMLRETGYAQAVIVAFEYCSAQLSLSQGRVIGDVEEQNSIELELLLDGSVTLHDTLLAILSM